jgi:hypothetical protein
VAHLKLHELLNLVCNEDADRYQHEPFHYGAPGSPPPLPMWVTKSRNRAMAAPQTMSQMTARNTRLVIIIRSVSGGEAEPGPTADRAKR